MRLEITEIQSSLLLGKEIPAERNFMGRISVTRQIAHTMIVGIT